jgi:hypothetical protein
MDDVFDHVQHDRDHGDYFSRARLEIPVSLSSGAVVSVVDRTVFWIENIRGYSTGLTLLTQLLVSPDLQAGLGIDVGPSLAGDHHAELDPAAEFIEVWVDTDGTRRTSVNHSLISIGGGGTPRLVHASWWVPVALPQELTIGFSWPAASLTGETTIDTSGWDALQNNILTL